MKKTYRYLYLIVFVFVALNVHAKTDDEKNIEPVDNSIIIDRIGNSDIEVSIPAIVFAFKEAKIKLKFKNPQHSKLLLNNNKLHFIINGEDIMLSFINGEASFTHTFDDGKPLSIYIEEFSYNQRITALSLWELLLPLALLLIWIIRKNAKKRTSPPTPAA